MVLTEEQMGWVDETLSNHEVIYCGIHGSHLYGLQREGSDVDVKAVVIPSFEELLLGRKNKVKQKKNDDLDIEMEIIPLDSFINSANSADTNVIDMLFSPDSMWLRETFIWRRLVSYRHDLLSKNMRGVVGYIKTHSHKYTNKIDRFVEMERLLNVIKAKGNPLQRISEFLEQYDLEDENFKFIRVVKLTTDHEQDYLEICGKKLIFSWRLEDLVLHLEREMSRYGRRTKLGVDVGLDTKSISHALRVIVEFEQLLLEGTITFPLREREFILDVKTGKIPLEQCMKEIDERYDRCMFLLEDTTLPENGSVNRMLLEFENLLYLWLEQKRK